MTTFGIGDRVRLTGDTWADFDLLGREVEVTGHDQDGDPTFVDDGGILAIYCYGPTEDFSAEPAEPVPSLEDRLTSPEAIQAFKDEWHAADADGQEGNRTRAGLLAVARFLEHGA